jgi:hypothetical protein
MARVVRIISRAGVGLASVGGRRGDAGGGDCGRREPNSGPRQLPRYWARSDCGFQCLAWKDQERNLGLQDAAAQGEQARSGTTPVALEAVLLARIEYLETAVEAHQKVGQAVGLMMGLHRLDSSNAFAAISRVATTNDLKIRELAEALLDLHDCPEPLQKSPASRAANSLLAGWVEKNGATGSDRR